MRLYILILLFFTHASSLRISAQCGACMQEVNVITNGDFSQGNSGFSTQMTLGSGFFCPLCPEGTYAVGSFAFLYHSDFVGQDHTNPPVGQFMIANGTAQEGVEVWCQNVELEPQTDYTIRYWGRDVTNNSNPHPLAVLHVSINGVLVGDSLVAEGGWQENVITWNSGDLVNAEICIVNYQSNPGGNDFGLDDISMTACHPVTLQHAADAGSDLEACGGETILLGSPGLVGYNYQWTGDAGLQNSGSSQPSFLAPADIDAITTYSFTLSLDSANLGCITQDMISVVVHPSPNLLLSGPTQICEGEEATISASGEFDTILWSTGANTSSVVVNSTGSIEAEASLGICTVSDALQLNVVELPEIDLGADLQLCETSMPYTLNASTSVLWNDLITSTEYEVVSSGEYVASFSSFNCSVSDTILIAVDTMPISTLEEEYTMCSGTSVVLSSGQIGVWNTGETASSIQVTDAGLYSVELSNGSCNLTSSAVVIEKFAPTPQLEEEVSFCEGEDYLLDPGSFEEAVYEWNDGDSLQIKRATSPGLYEVEVSNECGVATASTVVNVEFCDWGLYIPSAFTQDGNGINDDWVVKGHNVSNVKIFVYNRFGDMVFFTEELESPWTPDPFGVGLDAYTYRVEALNYNGVKIERHGHIRLLR